MKHLLLIFSLFISGCASASPKRYVFSRPMMFTQFDIVVYSSLSRTKTEASVAKVWDELDYWFRELSPAGEGTAAKLNKEGFLLPSHDPKAFAAISNFVVQAKAINRISGGAFDLTVYPLVRLWGFYKQDQHRIPSAAEIKEALKNVGMDKVSFSNGGILLQKGTRLDYGAIAKGFAVDRAVDILKVMPGIGAGFVNAGGNLRVFGAKPDATPWTVGVRDPLGEKDAQEIIAFFDGDSIATSGDYEQFFRGEDGRIYHHIFNPKTGTPAGHNLASVSVALIGGGNAETADMLSTTFLAAGPAQTERIIKEMGLETNIGVFFIERQGEDLRTTANDNWKRRKGLLERLGK